MEDKVKTGLSRRKFLQILGTASAVTATGCADSAEQNIFPNVKGDIEQVPGVATWYASTCTQCSAGCGIKVRTRDGRAVKIEGNSSHPVNRGGLCAIGQSALQELYDPDRVRQPLVRDRNSSGETFKAISWKDANELVKKALATAKKSVFLTDSVSGSLKKLISEFSSKYAAEHIVYNPAEAVQLAEACKLAYGVDGIPGFKFDQADLVVNFGADFLETFVDPCGYARSWADSRRSKHPLKFVHLEPRLSLTGANADLWISAKPGTEVYIARALLAAVAKDPKAKALGCTVEEAVAKSGVNRNKIEKLIKLLEESKSPLVLAGGSASSHTSSKSLMLVTALINIAKEAIGKTVDLTSVRKTQSDLVKISTAITEMQAGNVDVLFVHETNPNYSLPGSYAFENAVKNVSAKENGLVVSFSSKLDETARLADIILPANTSLESWGDVNDLENVHSLIQPVMTPVFDTHSLGDILIDLVADEKFAAGSKTFLDYLKADWQVLHKESKSTRTFETFWRESVEQGGLFLNAKAAPEVKTDSGIYNLIFEDAKFYDGGEIALLPFPSVRSFDGRTANRPWMQEIPDPITQIAWDSWAELHPKTAEKYGIKNGDLVQVDNFYGQLSVPAYVTEYVHPEIIAVPIGQGHANFGRFADDVKGGNVYNMLAKQDSDKSLNLFTSKVKVSKGRSTPMLAVAQGAVQGSNEQHGREIARTKWIEEKKHEDKKHAKHDEHASAGHHGEPEQMYDQRKHPLYKWAMAVDLAACTGCSACVAACYAENNIPTVGRRVFYQGREMSWIRIERYFEGPAEELNVSFIPMMCQHCQNAPCEPVCPVYATYHNEDGLNVMVYNRCVGTRYCGNNCSYKVRRFNWFEFEWPEPLNWQLNPDVTKRTAGIMEKCTFCVQRISGAKDHAKDEGRLIRDGEVQPACVQSCPTQALIFGNLNDAESKVSKIVKDERAYKVLDHHLNTQPSVSYLENQKNRI